MSLLVVQAQKGEGWLDVPTAGGDGTGIESRLAAECAMHAAFDGLAVRGVLAHFANSTVRVVLQVGISYFLVKFQKELYQIISLLSIL